MDLLTTINVKRENIEIEENEIPKEYFGNIDLKEDSISQPLEPAVFTIIDTAIIRRQGPKSSSETILKDTNCQRKQKKSKSSRKESKLKEKERYLKIKESYLKMKEATIKCKENLIKIKEANLKMREKKITNSKSKSRPKKSKEKKEAPTKHNNEAMNKEEQVFITETTKKCLVCDKILSSKSWNGHMIQIHSPTTYVCYCKKFFHARRTYDKHIQQVHNGVNRYPNPSPTGEVKEHKCTKCDSTFDHPYRLKTHMRNVHSGEGKTIRCELCQSQLKSQSYLHSHMKRVHYDDGKVHACLICGKKFKSPRYVKVHIKNSHEKHGLKVTSRKKKVRSEEYKDEARRSSQRIKDKTPVVDWQIPNYKREIKIEFEEDFSGFSLEGTCISPHPSRDVEIEDVKQENMP